MYLGVWSGFWHSFNRPVWPGVWYLYRGGGFISHSLPKSHPHLAVTRLLRYQGRSQVNMSGMLLTCTEIQYQARCLVTVLGVGPPPTCYCPLHPFIRLQLHEELLCLCPHDNTTRIYTQCYHGDTVSPSSQYFLCLWLVAFHLDHIGQLHWSFLNGKLAHCMGLWPAGNAGNCSFLGFFQQYWNRRLYSRYYILSLSYMWESYQTTRSLWHLYESGELSSVKVWWCQKVPVQ